MAEVPAALGVELVSPALKLVRRFREWIGPQVAPPPQNSTAYRTWILENEPGLGTLDLQRRQSAGLAWRPKISVLTPVYKIPVAVLRDMLDSVRTQTYDNWELCLAHGHTDDAAARAYLEGVAASDSRIKVMLLDTNEGIAGNSNQALTLVTGEFLALLDHDDMLAPFALFEVALLLNDHPGANFIYSDKDQLSERTGERVQPLFKPDWSPDILLSANYLTHLCVMRTDHVRAVGGWRRETEGAQDWDLFARLIARYGNVHHIPKVLYHWRQIAGSVAMSGFSVKPYAAEAQIQTLRLHCQEAGLDAEVTFDSRFGPHIQWNPIPAQKVSVVFLSRSLAQAEALMAATDYPNFEVRCVHVSAQDLAESIGETVTASTGDVLVFVDQSVTPADAGWLRELVGPFQDRGIGMIGAKLLDAGTHCLRHCGIVFTEQGRPEYVFSGMSEDGCNEFGMPGWYRDWSAVSGACFSIRRQAWDAIGGLSGPARYPRLDVPISLDVQFRAGMRVVYNPFARLYQDAPAALERSLWPEDETSRGYIRSLFPSGDPFFSKNLECLNGQIRIK